MKKEISCSGDKWNGKLQKLQEKVNDCETRLDAEKEANNLLQLDSEADRVSIETLNDNINTLTETVQFNADKVAKFDEMKRVGKQMQDRLRSNARMLEDKINEATRPLQVTLTTLSDENDELRAIAIRDQDHVRHALRQEHRAKVHIGELEDRIATLEQSCAAKDVQLDLEKRAVADYKCQRDGLLAALRSVDRSFC